MNLKIKISLFISLMLILLASCVTVWEREDSDQERPKKQTLFTLEQSGPEENEEEESIETAEKTEEMVGRRKTKDTEEALDREKQAEKIREKLIEGANILLKTQKLVVNGKKFRADCVGTLCAFYHYVGIDLTKDFGKYSGDGVTRIYKTLEANDLVYMTDYPKSGDIIIWDNTYDRNKDKKFNDNMTHVGMVMSVAEDGSIDYIHYDYITGIAIGKMNFLKADTNGEVIDGKWVMINTPIRIPVKGQQYPEKQNSAQLCRIFGMGYYLGVKEAEEEESEE